MAASGFQPLSDVEVAEQLNALGYKDFSPEKIKQITEESSSPNASTSSPQELLSMMSGAQVTTASNPSDLQLWKGKLSREDFTDPAVLNDVSVADSSDQSYSRDEGPISRQTYKPFIKRKVVRKRHGKAQIFDESVTESESDISYLNDRLADLHIPLRGEKPVSDDDDDTESEASTITRHPQSKRRPKSALSSRWSDSGLSQTSERYSSQPLKSFIRPTSAPVKWKHDKKTDPVTRHQMYAAHWKSKKAPGERNHKGLRWHIREQMLYKDDVVLPRQNPRVYVPNNYQVPTEKKRQALRWAVRNSLANREMPYSAFNF